MNELKSRGVEDVLIAIVDGLKGLSEAITATWSSQGARGIAQLRHVDGTGQSVLVEAHRL